MHEAYEIYKEIPCQYEELDLLHEIFTDDSIGGYSSFGRIRGIEAWTIFLMTRQRMGLVPGDHLW
jgi:hypothetical protein